MAAWLQSTPWRQGHVLKIESAKALGLVHPDDADDTAVVVISHDCDIVHTDDTEPFVEVIIGREIDAAKGNYRDAKAARTLHLPFTDGSDNSVVIELFAPLKRTIPKSSLAEHEPCATARLSARGRRTLRQWLIARYSRAAFPDEFVTRFGKYGIDDRLKTVLDRAQSHLVAVYFDLDADQDVEREGHDDLYTLSIYLVHAIDGDPAASRAIADTAKTAIEQAFQRCKKDGEWRGIKLEGCYVYAMSEITLDTVQYLRKWNTDYLSLRANPEGPIGAAD